MMSKNKLICRKNAAWTWYIRPEFSFGLSTPDLYSAIQEHSEKILVRRSNRIVSIVNVDGFRFVSRMITCNSIGRRITATLCGSDAVHNHRVNSFCRKRGLKTPLPYGFGICRKNGFIVSSCELNAFIPDQITLLEIKDKEPQWYSTCAQAAGEHCALLHNSHIYHGDYSPKNISVSAFTYDCTDLSMYDFDKMRTGVQFMWKRKRDLVKFLVYTYNIPFTDEDRDVFFASYRKAAGVSNAYTMYVRKYALRKLPRFAAGRTISTFKNNETIAQRGYL